MKKFCFQLSRNLTHKIVFRITIKTAKRSYYQILDIEPNFTKAQLRKKYLQRARIFHPDHNQQAQAVQQFKLLKQAYQTLKDPQKRMMYDSGVSETPMDVSPVHNQQVKTNKKYYQNKWYGFNKPKTQDQRDDYYQMKSDYFKTKPTNPLKYAASFSLILAAIFGYDLLMRIQSQKEKRDNSVKEVLANAQNTKQTKKQALMRRYMEQRASANKVDF